MTRRYDFFRVGGGFMQVLHNAIKKALLKGKKTRKKLAKIQVKTSDCYITVKGGQVICYEALHRVRGGLKSAIFSVR